MRCQMFSKDKLKKKYWDTIKLLIVGISVVTLISFILVYIGISGESSMNLEASANEKEDLDESYSNDESSIEEDGIKDEVVDSTDKVDVTSYDNINENNTSQALSTKDDINREYQEIERIDDIEEKINKLISLDKKCTRFLEHSNDNQILEIRMLINNKIGIAFNIESKKYEYFKEAKNIANRLVELYVDHDNIFRMNYYNAQFTHQMAELKFDDSIELYNECIFEFRKMLDIKPYWSRHYLISSYRCLYTATNNAEYLYEIRDVLTEETIRNNTNSFTDSQKKYLFTQLSDVYYNLGSDKVASDNGLSQKYYAKSLEYLNSALEYGYSLYLENQLNVLEGILDEK